jgi:hypothetical protein
MSLLKSRPKFMYVAQYVFVKNKYGTETLGKSSS